MSVKNKVKDAYEFYLYITITLVRIQRSNVSVIDDYFFLCIVYSW